MNNIGDYRRESSYTGPINRSETRGLDRSTRLNRLAEASRALSERTRANVANEQGANTVHDQARRLREQDIRIAHLERTLENLRGLGTLQADPGAMANLTPLLSNSEPNSPAPLNENRDVSDADRVQEYRRKKPKAGSCLRKLLACIPIVGIAITIFNERSLQKKIEISQDLSQIVTMIQVKNHYKVASVIRSVLTISFVASIVFSTLPILFGAGIAATACLVGVGAIFKYAYSRHQNIKLIRSLRTIPPSQEGFTGETSIAINDSARSIRVR